MTPDSSLALAALASCGCWLSLLLLAEGQGWRWLKYLSKPAASLSFLGLGAVCFVPGWYGWAVVVGLALGALGDVALMLPGKRTFLAGLVAFLLGHGGYVAAFAPAVRLSPQLWTLLGLFLSLSGYVLWKLRGQYGRLAGPVAVYGGVISVMAAFAWSFHASQGDTRPATTLAAWGATLFYISDLAVARNRFHKPNFLNKLWGLPTYYAGQCLMALSIAGGW